MPDRWSADNLPARFVLHAVGPVYGIGKEDAPSLLAACYENCLILAVQHAIRTIVFPAISCGAYGYQVEEACRIALDSASIFLERNDIPDKVIFVLYSCRDYIAYCEYYASKKASD